MQVSAWPQGTTAACMLESRMALAVLHVFSCRNGLILLLDISISLYLDIGFPCRGICGF